jgi:hypothetical protein
LNVSLNAIQAGSADADPVKWKVTQGRLEREAEKVRAARKEHLGKGEEWEASDWVWAGLSD